MFGEIIKLIYKDNEERQCVLNFKVGHPSEIQRTIIIKPGLDVLLDRLHHIQNLNITSNIYLKKKNLDIF